MDKVQFSDPLFFLRILGLSPFENDKFASIRRFLSVVAFVLGTFSGVLELLVHYNNFGTVIRASEVMFSYYQMGWRLIVLIKHKKELAHLIEATTEFWGLDQLGDMHKSKNCENHRFLRKCFRGYLGISYFSAFQYILAAIFSDKPMVLSFGETQGLNAASRHFYFILHMIFLFVLMTLISGFDGLFFYLIGHILSELKMVKIAFGQEEIQPHWHYKKRFKQGLIHHIFVLDYIRRLDQVYSMLLLNQQFSYLFGLCFGSVLMIIDGVPPDFEHVSKYVPYVCALSFQLWMFCFAGNLVSDWSLEIADQIFYKDWSLDRAYENKLDKIIILKRAQRPATLTLGGFQNLDLKSFTLVVKNAGSFFTFVNTMINK